MNKGCSVITVIDVRLLLYCGGGTSDVAENLWEGGEEEVRDQEMEWIVSTVVLMGWETKG